MRFCCVFRLQRRPLPRPRREKGRRGGGGRFFPATPCKMAAGVVEYLSQSGDIIVRLTAPYTAVLIDETTSGMVVSSNFVVIRVEDKSLLPEYLFWLLNTEKIKRKIYENATSNMLGAVNARFLADFELALLSVEDQRKIAQFNLMAKRERQLLRTLADEKEKYYAGVLNQAYQKAKRGK